ncbi:hypothetical protein [Streptomyces sp. CNQ085]|uniref:hypothetical protein n=1 Tax=Streptomyces sp. CNQ085 TaxID=2886944 RepID=UPI001F50ECCE|nr:hypothetical protein [Streptomyces sp. CNQ085]MCI0384520.1 hypothetical protein [Streptomyces sp. CNQ085]
MSIPAASGRGSASRDEPRDPASVLDFSDPLSRPAADDTDRGWGERPETGDDGGDGGAGDLARFLDERPPHHL